MAKKKRTPDEIAMGLMDGMTDNKFADNFRKNINVGGKDGTVMEDFRKLGMGLQGQIDANNVITPMYLAFSQTADQTIVSSDTETTLFGTGIGSLTLPANFWYIGRTIRLTVEGDFADAATPTFDVKVKFGSTTLSDSTAITLKALAGTEDWACVVAITCRSVGTTGTLETVVAFQYETTTGSSPLEQFDIAGTLTEVDTTVKGDMDITAQWGTSAAENTITSEIGLLEVLN